jgi:hypothetical protein
MQTISRRRFLGTGALAPLILHADDKAGTKRPVMGAGEHVYEAYHDWGALPPSIQYGNTHGVIEDSQGRIFVHHTVGSASESSDSMVVFDAGGKFVKSWGKDFKGGAHGLQIQREGSTEFLYLCDTRRGLVVKATLDGEEVFTLGYPEQSDAYKPGADGNRPKYSPTNLAIAPNGDLYVGDGYGSSYINQYNSKGEYLRTFGGKGREPGKVDCPHGIAVDMRGPNSRSSPSPTAPTIASSVSRWLESTLISSPAPTCRATSSYSRNGDVVIPDLGARVTLMDRDNRVIEHLGDDSSTKWQDTRKLPRDRFTAGKFVCPHSACFDREGNVFVVEWVEVGRVTKLKKV